MSDLAKLVNELVDDQVQKRSCIPLTDELEDFYRKFMRRDVDGEDSPSNLIDDEYVDDDRVERYKKSVKRFLTPKKRLTRKVVSCYPR